MAMEEKEKNKRKRNIKYLIYMKKGQVDLSINQA